MNLFTALQLAVAHLFHSLSVVESLGAYCVLALIGCYFLCKPAQG